MSPGPLQYIGALSLAALFLVGCGESESPVEKPAPPPTTPVTEAPAEGAPAVVPPADTADDEFEIQEQYEEHDDISKRSYSIELDGGMKVEVSGIWEGKTAGPGPATYISLNVTVVGQTDHKWAPGTAVQLVHSGGEKMSFPLLGGDGTPNEAGQRFNFALVSMTIDQAMVVLGDDLEELRIGDSSIELSPKERKRMRKVVRLTSGN